MARCSNAELMRKVSLKKLNKQTEVDLSLIKELPDCRRLKAKAFSKISGTYTWDNYMRPVNRFECLPKNCTTSGTLTLAAASETVVYQIPGDAREVASGILTFYVKASGAATVTVLLSEDDTFTNADQYTVSIGATDYLDDGYYPVTIDLSQTPTDVGDGWTPGPLSYVQISSDAIIALSTIDFFEDMGEFELNQTVKLSCLSSLGGTFDVPAIEARCAESQYDDNVNSLSFPVTAALASANWLFLNPMMGRGKEAEGFTIETIKKTVESATVGGKSYGKITLSDAADDCGFYAVQRADGCDPELMTEISIPTLQEFDMMHFQRIIEGENTVLYFNADLVGVEMLVSYPRAVEVEEYTANTDNLNEVHVRMSIPYETEGINGVKGTKYIYVFNNVLVTSFPFTVTDQDTSFPFTFTILRDDGGDFMHIYKIAS